MLGEVHHEAQVLPVGGNQKIDTTETGLQEGVGGTAGITQYVMRYDAGPVILTQATIAGTTLLILDLDLANFNDAHLQSMRLNFIFWLLRWFKITLQCCTNWSTASGTLQLFYNPDPENLVTLTSANLVLALRNLGSKQISGKAAIDFLIPFSAFHSEVYPSQWKYCKKAANSQPRTERFGQLVIVSRSPPDAGDGSTFTVTVEALVEFKDATKNSVASAYRIPITLPQEQYTASPLYRNNEFYLAFQTTEPFMFQGTIVNASGMFVLHTPTLFTFSLSDPAGEMADEKYGLTLKTGYFMTNEEGILRILFPTRVTANTGLTSDAELTFNGVDLIGTLLYSAYTDPNDFYGGHHLSHIPVANIGQPLSEKLNSQAARILETHRTINSRMQNVGGVFFDTQV